MINLCEYKDFFGKPKEGIHSYRIFNIAIVDLVFTIIIAWLISYFFKISFIMTTIILLLLGIIMHKIFCVNTTVNILLFDN